MVAFRELVPWWWALAVTATYLVVTGLLVLLALAAEGGLAQLGRLLLLPWSATGVLIWYAAWAPRRRRALPVATDGSLTIASPVILGWAVAVVWLSFPVVGVASGVIFITGREDFSRPGGLVALAVAGLAGLPWAIGVLTGRVRRWRLVIGAQGLRYRALRSETALTWDEVRETDVERKPVAGLRIHRRGAKPGPILMAAVFTVPVHQIAEEIERRRR